MADKGGESDSLLFIFAASICAAIILGKLKALLLGGIASPMSRAMAFVGLVGVLTPLFYWLCARRDRRLEERRRADAVIGPAEGSVFCGGSDDGQEVHVKPAQRSMHTQVIGTTNAGKTESVILPWAIQDIQQGRGLILIDGKSDRSLLNKIWAYAVRSGRASSFRLFSLQNVDESQQFNPLLGGTPEEISERVFNAFEFENEYYRSIQFEVFSQTMRIFAGARIVPTFPRLHEAISNPNKLMALARITEDAGLIEWVQAFRSLTVNERAQRVSGLLAAMSHFSFGKTAALFDSETPSITLDKALEENLIVYFQLPVLLSPFLGRASGKMILQCLQSAVALRHRATGKESHRFFSVFLDDFSEYLYPGFVSILNKSRSANVGVVFAHQALGDIKALGDSVANSILTNANIKVFMRGNDPESAEYFAKVIGTVRATKYTERTKKGFFRHDTTGDASAREVEEFIVHPNDFKSALGVGEAVMVLPHERGSHHLRIKFKKYDDLPAQQIEVVPKQVAGGLVIPAKKDGSRKSDPKEAAA